MYPDKRKLQASDNTSLAILSFQDTHSQSSQPSISQDLPQECSQHENGDLRRIKVCVNLRKVGHPTLRKLSTARKGL